MRNYLRLVLLLLPSTFGLGIRALPLQAFQTSLQSTLRTPEGKPDFSGFWTSPVTVDVIDPLAEGWPLIGWEKKIFSPEKMAPFKPGGESLFYEPRTGDLRHDEPRAACLAAGFPNGMLYSLPVQIVQTAKYIVIIHEGQRITRIIPLDGRPHRKDLEPSYYGDSIGHWEGDSLVIDTTNFKRWILDDYHYTDPTKSRWHSDAFHTIERLQRQDAKNILYSITIDDPKIFTKPWSQDFRMTLHPEWEEPGLLEYVCAENNRCIGGECRNNK